MTIKTIHTDSFFPGIEVSNATKAEAKILRDRAMYLWDLDRRLSDMERTARECLEKAGVRFFPGGAESRISEKEWEDRPELRDANRILNDIGQLRDFMTEQNYQRAICVALNLGQDSVMFSVRPHEKPAKAGRQAFQNLANGRQKGVDRYADARDRHRQWLEMAATMTGQASVKARRIAESINADRRDLEEKEIKADTIRKFLSKHPPKDSRKIRA